MKPTGNESRFHPLRRFLIGVALTALLPIALPVAATGQPAPVPAATRPSAADLRRWVGQLDDADPEIRESAAHLLMGLSRDDLAALRDAAIAQRPLTGAQLAALRETVMQVFLESEPYTPDGKVAFLGIHWPTLMERYDIGVIVADRIPGFGAYRLLRPGDVIVKLPDFPDSDLHARDGLIHPIASMRPGDLLRLQLLRGGRLIEVSVPLAARPLELADPVSDPGKYRTWLDERMHKAQQYWNDSFAPLARDLEQTVDTQP
jgi:hypothetical protein